MLNTFVPDRSSGDRALTGIKVTLIKHLTDQTPFQRCPTGESTASLRFSLVLSAVFALSEDIHVNLLAADANQNCQQRSQDNDAY